ncbi:MAG: GspE/PulE family protein [Candidatus Omnitrophica bacterium]|nr:GspE/PulE family protein [Candidatus Omnitrophota bacterium]
MSDKFKNNDNLIELCENTFYPPINLKNYQVEKETLSIIPQRIALAYAVIPLDSVEFILTVAMSDPLDIATIDNLKAATKMDISPVIASDEDITEALIKYYNKPTDSESIDRNNSLESDTGKFSELKEGSAQFSMDEVCELSQKTKIIDALNQILIDAIKLKASDIHIEPCQYYVRVRYRIDGILHQIHRMDKHFQEAIIARIKIMSRLDITQRRVSQDGRFSFNTEVHKIDVRVSVLPIDFGEKIVLRLLNQENISFSMEKLGFSQYATTAFNTALEKPLGLILLTGPTGSGKTTTLYTLLSRLNTDQRSLITLEDPVEYNLAGVSQVPIRHEIGLDFATILRATLRQSPDILMLGEIRDSETADIAMKAALTGHIVFSTLHTNDAPSAITRLLNMGLEPFLISFAVNMIAAQRLVRTICPDCKTSLKEDLSNRGEIPLQYRKRDVILYKGAGCKKCNNTGYKGRVAIIEALLFDPIIRDLIIHKASLEEIRTYAREKCAMKTLREDAMEKCLKGETTLEEIMRVTTEI